MAKALTAYEQELDKKEMPAGKKKVLLAALHLFANNGFHGTTTAKIAKKAGVSEGTIYKYFGSKKELLVALLTPILTEIKDNFFGELNGYQDLDELISFIIRDRRAFVQDNFDFIKLILQELLIDQQELQGIYHDIFAGSNDLFERIEKLKQSYPEINPRLSPLQIIRCVLGPAVAFIFQENLLGIKNTADDVQLLHKQIMAGLTK